MKDAPLLRGSLAVRLVALFVGLLLIAAAIVSMLESGLGLPPWDVFHLGVARHTPLTLGTSAVVVGFAIAAVQQLAASALIVRVGLVALGVLLFGVGSAFYIGAGMGAGPRDSFMLALTRRTGWRIGLVRGAIEVTVLVAGLLLGGVAGVGTLALALLVGPSVELSFWLLLRLGLASPSVRAVDFGPLDVG